LNSGLCTCKAGALPLEPLLQSILLWLFWRWNLESYLPGLALNPDPSHLGLPRITGMSQWHPATEAFQAFFWPFSFQTNLNPAIRFFLGRVVDWNSGAYTYSVCTGPLSYTPRDLTCHTGWSPDNCVAFCFAFVFWWNWGLNSGFHALKPGSTARATPPARSASFPSSQSLPPELPGLQVFLEHVPG
jgi:hypothetical protein